MRYTRFCIGFIIGILIWVAVYVIPNHKEFMNTIKLAHTLEPGFFERGVIYSVKKEYQRWKGFFWLSRGHRNMLYLLLVPFFLKASISLEFCGFFYALVLAVLALTIFCANSFTFYIIIFWPVLALAYLGSGKKVKWTLGCLFLVELLYVSLNVRTTNYFERIKETIHLTAGANNIMIPTEYWPYIRRGIVDNYFHIHNYPAWKKEPKDVLKDYGIEVYIKSPNVYYWETND